MPKFALKILRPQALLIVGLLVLSILLRPASGLAQEPQAASTWEARYDLTGNQVVNASDAWTISAGWNDVQQIGLCLTPELASHDLDSSGCVDVSDVQLVMNQWGATTLPAADERAPAAPTLFVVDSVGDEGDSAVGDGFCNSWAGTCTLRAAIQESNIRPGPETIHFDIRNPNGSCPSLVTIQPADSLTIDDAHWDGVTIDGYTQCGASPNSLAVGGNAQIRIELRSPGSPAYDGIRINTPNNVIRGLAIYGFQRQLRLFGPATHNQLQGNFLGTNAANTYVQAQASSLYGLGMLYTPAYNVIGCGYYTSTNEFVPCQTQAEFAAARNIVAGNGNDGINIDGRVREVRIVGNYVGVAQDGRTALRNGSDGVDLGSGPYRNWIGGTRPGEGNVISANLGDGIEMSHDTRTQFNQITGNLIGLDAFGTRALGNRVNGITIEDTPDSISIYNNTISGNGSNGIRLFMHITNAQIYDNRIGVAADGVTARPNGTNASSDKGRSGVLAMGGSEHNIIRDNIIANNGKYGVFLSNTTYGVGTGYAPTYYNTISQNSLYNNGNVGIRLEAADYSTSGDVANQSLPAPRITNATTSLVSGTTCARCRVEVFIADKSALNDPGGENNGEGQTFIGSAEATAQGSFAVPVSGVAQGQLVTATATDDPGNTSTFSRNVLVGSGTTQPTPTSTRTPTPNPSATATLTHTPSPTPIATATNTPSATPTRTPSPTAAPSRTPTVTPSATPRPAGNYTARIPIQQWVDDAEEAVVNGQVSRRDSDLELITDPWWQGEQVVGLRFQSLPIPPGSTITRASIEFVTDEVRSEPTYLQFRAEATDNAPVIEWMDYNISSRNRTVAAVGWSNVPVWQSVGATYRTPNLAPIVQEVVNRAGWQEGNSMLFVVTGTGRRVGVASDTDFNQAPVLHLEYTSATTPNLEQRQLSALPEDEPLFFPLIIR